MPISTALGKLKTYDPGGVFPHHNTMQGINTKEEYKTTNCLLILTGLAISILLTAMNPGCSGNPPSLQAGAHSIDITPVQLPAIANGGFIQRIEDKVLDPLHARCFIFKSE